MIRNIFDKWNIEKQRIDLIPENNIYINPRELWFTKMGKNIGFEEDGKEGFARPVLVIKKVGNLFFTVALTTQGKDSHFYHKFIKINLFEKYQKNTNSSYVILSQVRVMDKRRFINMIGTVEKSEFEVIKQKLTTLLL
jgi:mRNA interferase MazF